MSVFRRCGGGARAAAGGRKKRGPEGPLSVSRIGWCVAARPCPLPVCPIRVRGERTRPRTHVSSATPARGAAGVAIHAGDVAHRSEVVLPHSFEAHKTTLSYLFLGRSSSCRKTLRLTSRWTLVISTTSENALLANVKASSFRSSNAGPH